MFNLKIDSETKNISIDMKLKGETKSLEMEIKEYSIIKENDKTFIEITELETNREWINIIIDTYMKNRRVEVPHKYASLLEIVL